MITDAERAKLIEFCAQVNELNLNEKDEAILRQLLLLISSWELKTALIKKKELKMKIEKGMTFSNCEKAQAKAYVA